MLAVMLIVPHVCALIVLPWLTIPFSVSILLAGIIVASLYQAMKTHVLFRSEKSVTALIWDMSAGLKITDREGNVCEALIKEDFFVHPFLIILNLQLVEGGNRTLMLLPDSAEGESLRRLRLRLLLDGLPKEE
jgi:hypothetical protein